jgi:hypothetical protein
MNFAKNFKAHQEKRKEAMVKQAQKTMEEGKKIRAIMARVKKEDQE